ncbi:MAG: sulfite exporter TauE/SafE family protein [Thermoplasmatota archaeon]
MPIVFFVVLLLASIVGGLLGALLGLGGGVIIVPTLTLFLGVPPLFAIGASIVSVIATSSGAAATYVRDHITNLRVGMFLELATSLGAITGAVLTIALAKYNLEDAIYVLFGFALILSALPLLGRIGQEIPTDVVPDAISRKLELSGAYYDHVLRKEVQYEATHSYFALGIMYIAGLLSGLLGIGAGVLKVLAMDSTMKLPMKVSSTTSNFMIGVTAAASTGIFYLSGYINPFIAAPVILGVVIGSIFGTRLLVRTKNTSIKKIFIPVILLLAAEMLVRGFHL